MQNKIERIAENKRTTNETDIFLKINLDGSGCFKVNTPCQFFNHMIEQFSLHSGFDIELSAKSLDGNFHHLIEDCAIVMGLSIKNALQEKIGIKRYSNIVLPMDDALILCSLDISNRPYFKLSGDIKDEKTDDFETTLFYHFLNSFSMNLGLCLHIKILDGFDSHHIIEAAFKALAKCLKEASIITGDSLPSTKGLL